MASWKTVCIVKMMLLWNYMREVINSTYDKCYNFYDYLKDYFYGHHDTWVFIPGHTNPLSISNLYNLVHANWTYDNFDNSLSLLVPDNVTLTTYRFSWLSAKIRIFKTETKGYEYDIDDFLERFSLKTTDEIVPSLYMVFMCWCVYTKHWYSASDHIEFQVIDDTGEEIILNIEDHNDSLCIRKNKIIVVVHTGEDDITNISQVNEIVEPPNEETPLQEENKSKED
jgi:hypothetical protein